MPNPEIDLTAFYNSYLVTYLKRDVRSLTNVGSLRDFEKFIRACALRSANLLNKADGAGRAGAASLNFSHPAFVTDRDLTTDDSLAQGSL